MKHTQSWVERLRELYLTTSPDEQGLITGSISFQWATFKIEPHEKKIEYYLLGRDALEEFVAQLLTENEQKVLAEERAKTALEAVEVLHSMIMKTTNLPTIDILEKAQRELLIALSPHHQ